MSNFAKPVPQCGIFCIESPWEASSEAADATVMKSTLPGLQLITRYHGYADLNYKTCATIGELKYHVKDFRNLSKSTRNWYGLVYFAMHGSSGKVNLAGEDDPITLSQLAVILGAAFKDFTVYFGSCSVMKCSDDDLAAFTQATGVDCVVGYDTDVDWVDSTVLDILFMDRFIRRNRSKKVFWDKFYKDYGFLIDKFGMRFYG